MKWSSVFLVSLTATGLLLSSCEGPVPVGLLLPQVTGMSETATASDVTMTCTLSGNVDNCQFIRLFRFVVL